MEIAGTFPLHALPWIFNLPVLSHPDQQERLEPPSGREVPNGVRQKEPAWQGWQKI